MSILRCQGENCIVPIDTDLDTECAVPDPRYSTGPHPDLILCPRCRAQFAAQLEAAGGGGIL